MNDNYEQQQIQEIIDDKVRSNHADELNIARMMIQSENAKTKFINISMEQLQAIKKILG